MIITVASFKGGVGKTTSAIHLAAYLQEKAPTLLIDGDQNRSASTWAEGGNLGFKVVSETQAPKYIRQFEHIVIDTQARPEQKDLEALADGCDLLILPTTPKALDLDALLRTVDVLTKLGANFKVLLTIVPPLPSRSGEEARKLLAEANLPVFKSEIKRLVAFERAPLAGVIVRDYPDARSEQAWEGYEAVGQEILP
ncbi:ParA family protein [Pantanalinema rosaneae CENA516]|uniref:ParA family protein n=1 Tax=Pantanalinema rosaneae TaxID=1620701 RepID=UPI003D6EDF06